MDVFIFNFNLDKARYTADIFRALKALFIIIIENDKWTQNKYANYPKFEILKYSHCHGNFKRPGIDSAALKNYFFIPILSVLVEVRSFEVIPWSQVRELKKGVVM